MGYTHYWKPKGELPQETWSAVVEAVHGACAIAVASGIRLAGPDGTGKMLLTESEIAFNGAGDEAYESFWIDRVPDAREGREPGWEHFGFCKTAYRPYDVVVVAALCLMEHVSGGHFRVSSDGDESDWSAGLALARQVLSSAEIPAGVRESE